jgi:GntR family transcriptional repressor for pyruvate dehydrogenase complex
MNLPKLQKSRLTDQVAETLYKKIADGDLRPGDKLPSEMELSEQLGVARPTIREALSRLIGLGLIERGDYTMSVSENASLTARARLMPLLLEQWETRELYEARMLIEGDLVSLAVLKATPDDISELRQINGRMKDPDMTEKNYWENDMQFHSYLATVSGNEVMQAISVIINDMFKRYQSKVEELHSIQAVTYNDHEALIDAIEKRNAPLAREIINRMLSSSENALYELSEKEQEKT